MGGTFVQTEWHQIRNQWNKIYLKLFTFVGLIVNWVIRNWRENQETRNESNHSIIQKTIQLDESGDNLLRKKSRDYNKFKILTHLSRDREPRNILWCTWMRKIIGRRTRKVLKQIVLIRCNFSFTGTRILQWLNWNFNAQ